MSSSLVFTELNFHSYAYTHSLLQTVACLPLFWLEQSIYGRRTALANDSSEGRIKAGWHLEWPRFHCASTVRRVTWQSSIMKCLSKSNKEPYAIEFKWSNIICKMGTSVFWLIHMQLQYMQAQTIPKKTSKQSQSDESGVLSSHSVAILGRWQQFLVVRPAGTSHNVREANKEQEVRIITCLVFKISHLQNEPCEFKYSSRRSDQEEIYVGRMDTLVQHNNIGRQFEF